jgi:hypothetical protein
MSKPGEFAQREIIIPHDPAAGPVTQVKNLLIQFSLDQLRDGGHYDAYSKLVAPDVLQDLLARLAPGWLPVELAVAHYEACDKLGLDAEQLDRVGRLVGDRIQDATLVSAAKRARERDFDIWSAMSQIHRTWSRLYQGGSVQFVKIGPKDLLLEERGYPMNRCQYFRRGHLGSLAARFAALGTELTRREVLEVEADDVVIHLGWR